MAEEVTTPDVTESKADDWKAPATQDELNHIIEGRLARERAKFADYDAVVAKAAEFDKAQEEGKTELQKALDVAAASKTETTTDRERANRAEVALVKGLTPTQAKRLVGSTREELEADADELLKDLKADASRGPRAPHQKTSQSDPKDDPMREFAQNLFKSGE